MLLTYAIPCHSRVADLCESMPSIVAAANASPPVEILIVDYACKDNIARALLSAPDNALSTLRVGNRLRIIRYDGRDHFHCTHARNLGIRYALGDYVMASSADVGLELNAFAVIRQVIEETGATWLTPSDREPGFSICRRDELVAAGGFDERFEFYGPDDRELVHRLTRRGTPKAMFPYSVLRVRRTPPKLKYDGYRLGVDEARPHIIRQRELMAESVARGALVANDGVDWGAL